MNLPSRYLQVEDWTAPASTVSEEVPSFAVYEYVGDEACEHGEFPTLREAAACAQAKAAELGVPLLPALAVLETDGSTAHQPLAEALAKEALETALAGGETAATGPDHAPRARLAPKAGAR